MDDKLPDHIHSWIDVNNVERTNPRRLPAVLFDSQEHFDKVKAKWDAMGTEIQRLREVLQQVQIEASGHRIKHLKLVPGENVKMYDGPPEWVVIEDIESIALTALEPSRISNVPFEEQCPKCGGELYEGYGLAFGGGPGSYQTCECGWATKHPDQGGV